MAELRIDISGNPPSVGHYNAQRVVIPRQGKPFVQVYPTAQAKAWWETVAAAVQGRQIRGATYTVSYVVFTKTAACPDVDNFAKCVLDSLAKAGAIDNDRKVIDLHGYRRIDRVNPRTVIIVKTDQESLL